MSAPILDLQIACEDAPRPTEDDFRHWVTQALAGADCQLAEPELTIRLVNADEMTALNRDYRHKDKPTNVLSFPFSPPPGISLPLLGDIVICASVIGEEAKAQGKEVMHHWAHMTIHGVLHLLGYDHIEAQDARQMEGLEIEILAQLCIDDPYQDH